MIIPIRCFTCGNVIGDKWNPFIELIMEKKNASKTPVNGSDVDIKYIDIQKDGSIQKSIEGEAMDELNLHKYCCRRMILGNAHLISYI
jgi:DNA-directed RNA polymerase subunit N (RpoN/RPB10)